MTDSHVFVSLGNLLHLNCDAWLLPSDQRLTISSPWRKQPGLVTAVGESCPQEFKDGRRLAFPLKNWPTEEPLPIVTAVPLQGARSAADLEPAIREFIDRAATASLTRRNWAPSNARPRPLLAMPSFGAAGGGGDAFRGDVLKMILEVARDSAMKAGVDIVLVLQDAQMFALAQVLRKQSANDFWPELSNGTQLDRVKKLSAEARAGRLVPFMGAGVSVSAGAPTWRELVVRLADGIELTAAERGALLSSDRNVLDQSAFLRAAYENRQTAAVPPTSDAFARAIVDAVDVPRYGLAPALLASLKTEQAITLNYDRLFEMASTDAGMPRAVIPDDNTNAASASRAWLLKLHGSVTRPDSIVLTRDDYLGYSASRAALSAIVKATLITHHLLFVGFGLADDHFHQIIHDVRQALPSARQNGNPFATALTLFDDPLNSALWEGQLELVPMGSSRAGISEAARSLEIFLDALVAHATDSHSYFLSPGFENTLSSPEQALRARLLDFAEHSTDPERESAPWSTLARTLDQLGWEPERTR